LGIHIDGIRTQIRAEEQVVLQSLRADVMKSLSVLRKNASVLDRIDIACSFATLARAQNHVRPLLNLGYSLPPFACWNDIRAEFIFFPGIAYPIKSLEADIPPLRLGSRVKDAHSRLTIASWAIGKGSGLSLGAF